MGAGKPAMDPVLVRQKYLGGLLDWKVGRLVGGEDFAAFSCEFTNLTFCGPPPGNIVTSAW